MMMDTRMKFDLGDEVQTKEEGDDNEAQMKEEGDDNEVQAKEDEPLFNASSVPGILYEGEEVQTCPLCNDRLMWYHLPQDMEILVCANPMCVYPFDDISPYNVRSRTLDKVCIEGTPAPLQAQLDDSTKEEAGLMSCD